MKKIFLVVILLGSILQVSNAQTVNFDRKMPPVQLTGMPVISPPPYQRKSGDEGISIGDFNSSYFGIKPISATLLNTSLLCYKNKKVTDFQNYPPAFQPKRDYSRDEIMILPATNTYDIIEILDKDRILTQW